MSAQESICNLLYIRRNMENPISLYFRFLVIAVLIIQLQVAMGQLPEDSSRASSVQPVAIELKTFVESSKVPANGFVVFHIQLSWIGDLSRFRIQTIPQPILTNLLMEGSGSSNKLEPLADGRFRAVKTITYRFRPVEMGMAYIDGIEVKYVDEATQREDTLQSQRVMVEITEPTADGGRRGKWAVVFIVLLIVFFGTITYFVFQYFRKRRQAGTEFQPLVSPAQIYLEKIAAEVDPKGANLREMLFRLSKLFREFLRREFHLPAGEMAGSEMAGYLKDHSDLSPAEIERIQTLFEELEVIKFSGNTVDSQAFSRIFAVVEEFLHIRKQKWEAQQYQHKEA